MTAAERVLLRQIRDLQARIRQLEREEARLRERIADERARSQKREAQLRALLVLVDRGERDAA